MPLPRLPTIPVGHLVFGGGGPYREQRVGRTQHGSAHLVLMAGQLVQGHAPGIGADGCFCGGPDFGLGRRGRLYPAPLWRGRVLRSVQVVQGGLVLSMDAGQAHGAGDGSLLMHDGKAAQPGGDLGRGRIVNFGFGRTCSLLASRLCGKRCAHLSGVM